MSGPDLTDFEHDSPLWRYAVNLYGRPGVRDWLLELQNRLAVDVNFVLFACWCGEHGLELSRGDWRQLSETTVTLRDVVIAPLRRQRFRLTVVMHEAISRVLLQAELVAENALYGQLWDWWCAHPEHPAPVSPSCARRLCARNLDILATFYAITTFAESRSLLEQLPLTAT